MKDELQTVFEVIAGSPVVQGMRGSFQDEWLVHRSIVAAKNCLEHANPTIVAQKFASEFALSSLGDDGATAFFVGQAAEACKRLKVDEFLAGFHVCNVSCHKNDTLAKAVAEDAAATEPSVVVETSVVATAPAADVPDVELTVDSLALPATIRKALKSNGLETVAQVEHQIANGGLEPLPLIGATSAVRIADAVAKLRG